MNLCADCKLAGFGRLSVCEWEREFKPVDGWDAVYVDRDYHKIERGSYEIKQCPKFVPSPPRKKIELPKYSVEDSDRQIAELAKRADAQRVFYNEKKCVERLARKNKRYADGICVRCGKRPRRDGFTECDVCTAKRAAERRRRKERDAL